MSRAEKTPQRMTCERLVELLTDYVDGELPADVKQQIDQHIGVCAPCVAFLAEYKFAPEAVRRTLLKAVPQGVEDRLLGFLRGRCHKK